MAGSIGLASFCRHWYAVLVLSTDMMLTSLRCLLDSFIVGSMIQTMISINDPTYEPKRWQATLLIIAVSVGVGAFNVLSAQWLALAEIMFAVLHFVAFFPIVITLLTTTSPFKTASEVFLDFSDNGAGWPSLGLTVLVGQVSAMFTVLGMTLA